MKAFEAGMGPEALWLNPEPWSLHFLLDTLLAT
jgi:hypothetical protein